MNPVDSVAYRLALTGAIDIAATAVAGGVIDIRAPRGIVWDSLATVENWPEIRADISDVVAAGPARTGASFTWHAAGTPVTSVFALSDRPSRLAWATTAPGFFMVAVYQFDELGPDHTRIRCQESMNGTAVPPGIDHDVLAELIRTWLKGISKFVDHRLSQSGTAEPSTIT